MYNVFEDTHQGDEVKYIRRLKMNVTVNDSCIGCGACESICDAVFKVEDKAVVESSAVAANEDCVKEAAEACPVSAIEVA